MINRWFGRTLRHLLATTVMLALAACGGGGGGEGGFLGPPDAQTPNDLVRISITMVNANGETISEIDTLNPGTVRVTVTNPSGAALADQLVSLTAQGVGVVEPASGTALTNGDGVATFTLTAGSVTGAGSLTASVATSAGDATTSYNVGVTVLPYTISATLRDVAGNVITTVDPLNQGYYRVTILDPAGAPAVNQLVVATTTVGNLLPTNGQAVTNESGVAFFIVQSADTDGAGTLTATADTPDNATLTTDVNFEVSTELPYVLTVGVLDATTGAVLDTAETSQDVTLIVDVTDSRDGSPIPGQVVTVDIGALGSIIPDSGNALTDDNGRASFAVSVGQSTGAFGLTVSAVLPGGAVTQQFDLSVDQAVRKLGYFNDNGDFIEGQIDIEPGDQLSPGGTAALTFAVVDANNERADSTETVEISSECLFGSQATLDPASPITFNSQATVSYTVAGCSGADELTVTLASTGAEATGVVSIAELVPESIAFTAADPEIIALRDTGNSSNLTESSSVSFTVTDLDGNPVSDVKVNFQLTTTIGGVSLTCANDPICEYADAQDAAEERSVTATDRSDLNGVAVVELRSGFVATPVRVLAYIDLDEDDVLDPAEPQTTSTALVITTGLPDQDSVSVSASTLNIEGAYVVDGKSSTITVRMADKFNNPVPDGTQAVFTTEYGSIVGSCTLTGGVCSVPWTSQAPRDSAFADPIRIFNDSRYDCPAHNESSGPCPLDIADPTVNPPGYARGGRTTILVTAIGEESFVDANGNGLYDQGEFWTNLPEAWRDENEDGVHTPTQRANCSNPATADDICLAGFDEQFVDFNENGVYDLNNQPLRPGSSLPDGLFNSVLCRPEDAAVGICSRELLNVRDQLVLINAFDVASDYDLLVIEADERNEPGSSDPLDDGELYLLYIADIFNNPPPGGSEVSFQGSGRCDVTTPAPTIGDTNRAGAFTVSFAVATADGEDPTADPDQVSILLTLPNGSITVATYSCLVEDPVPADPGGDGGPDFSPGS